MITSHEVPTHVEVEETIAVSEEVRLPKKVVVFSLAAGGAVFLLMQGGISFETALYVWLAAVAGYALYAAYRRQKLNLLQWALVLFSFYTRPRVLLWMRPPALERTLELARKNK